MPFFITVILLEIPMYYVLFNLESITPKAFSAKLNSRMKLHYYSLLTREANFSGFPFIAINDKFGPIYRDKFDKIR